MDTRSDRPDPAEMAAEIVAEIRALPLRNTPNVRAVRRRYSHALRAADPAWVLDLARELGATDTGDETHLLCRTQQRGTRMKHTPTGIVPGTWTLTLLTFFAVGGATTCAAG